MGFIKEKLKEKLLDAMKKNGAEDSALQEFVNELVVTLRVEKKITEEELNDDIYIELEEILNALLCIRGQIELLKEEMPQIMPEALQKVIESVEGISEHLGRITELAKDIQWTGISDDVDDAAEELMDTVVDVSNNAEEIAEEIERLKNAIKENDEGVQRITEELQNVTEDICDDIYMVVCAIEDLQEVLEEIEEEADEDL